MAELRFAHPTAEDIDHLAQHMREQDVAEVLAAGHDNLRHVLEHGVQASTWCWSAFVDGELACIFGVAPLGTLLDSRGAPWLLGTDLIPKHRRIFARHARRYIDAMLAAHPQLVNAVHARNTVAVQWLQRMGFHLEPAHPAGPHGEPFHVFTMSR